MKKIISFILLFTLFISIFSVNDSYAFRRESPEDSVDILDELGESKEDAVKDTAIIIGAVIGGMLLIGVVTYLYYRSKNNKQSFSNFLNKFDNSISSDNSIFQLTFLNIEKSNGNIISNFENKGDYSGIDQVPMLKINLIRW